MQGRAATALLQPNTVALSATQARTYFGTDKAVGRSLTLNNRFGKTLYTVAAVYADMPPNSDFQFDAVFSFSTTGIAKQNPLPQADKKGYSMGVIDNRFLPTYDIQLAAGRNFTQQEAELAWEKSAKLLVNETAARQLGFASAAQAVGQSINWGTTGYEIVGVVKDYHHQGFRQLIDPDIFLPGRSVGDLTIQLTIDGRSTA